MGNDQEITVVEIDLDGGYKYIGLAPTPTEYIARGTIYDLQFPYIEFTASWTALALGEVEDGDLGLVPFHVEVGSPRDSAISGINITPEMHKRLVDARPNLALAMDRFRILEGTDDAALEIMATIDTICALEIAGSELKRDIGTKGRHPNSIVYREVPLRRTWPPPMGQIPSPGTRPPISPADDR